MGIVKLIGSGIGLASEALAHRNALKARNTATTPSETTRPYVETPGESSRGTALAHEPNEPPPVYAELPDDQANALIARGEAAPVDPKEEDHIRKTEGVEEDSVSEEELDEEQWVLDEAADPPEYTEYPASPKDASKDANTLADVFLRNHPSPIPTVASANLPCPVILPQRRPKDKTRGFIRAYAPVLADCSIDQNTFMDWLKNFHQASQASPWFTVVNIAARGAGMVPSPIAMGVSIGVQVAVGTAIEIQRRSRANSYLDRMNNEFFRPRGLYCLVMTYKPDSSSTHASVNINQAITSSLFPSTSTKQTLAKLKNSSGKTYGENEMPEAAPLIFPALDQLADATSSEETKKQNSLKSSKKFVSDYMDKRARAKYAAENPDSSLAQSNQQFSSRFADPNSAVYGGGLITFASGGLIAGRRNGGKGPIHGLVAAGKDYMASRKEGSGSGAAVTQQSEDESEHMRGSRRAVRSDRRDRRRKKGLVRRVLQKDVLYLMIVNMPSEEELLAARQFIPDEQIR